MGRNTQRSSPWAGGIRRKPLKFNSNLKSNGTYEILEIITYNYIKSQYKL